MNVILVLLVVCAPAPFEKSCPHQRLGKARLCGHWTMTWSGQPYEVCLSARGDYECRSTVTSTVVYRGTWGVGKDGLLWVSETPFYDPSCLRTYGVKLDPHTLSGTVLYGAPGTPVTLRRLR